MIRRFASISRLMIGGTLVAALSLTACEERPGSAGEMPEGPPKLEVVGGTTIDWGRVGPATLKRSLKITNAGGDTLRITDVKPSCGCTTAPLDKNVLLPGDTATVDVAIDMNNREGSQQKSITIRSNDSTAAATIVQLKAYIVRDIVARPDFFPINDQVKPGAVVQTEVEIVNTGEESVTVNPPQLKNAGLVVDFDMDAPRTLAPGESMKLVAHVKPIREGISTADVILSTTSEISPELNLSITCDAKA